MYFCMNLNVNNYNLEYGKYQSERCKVLVGGGTGINVHSVSPHN
jgi:hypothetical protein